MPDRSAGINSKKMALATLICFLLSCSCSGKRSSLDLRTPEDAAILGRLRFLCGADCDGDFRLPTFELRSIRGAPPVPFATLGSLHIQEGQRLEVPIVQRVSPGTYELRMKSVEAPPQSPWLEASQVTLIGFSAGPDQLVYIGTVEVEIRCQRWERQSATYYVSHSVRDEFAQEITRLRDDFPELYETYQSNIILEVD